MKALAYTIYVLSILLISGLARAHADQLVPTEAQYDRPVKIESVRESKFAPLNLVLSGRLPNPGYDVPSAMVIQDVSNPQVLTVHLTTHAPTNINIERIQNFVTTIALPMLVDASQIHIESDAKYVILLDGTPFSMEVNGKDLLK